MSYTDLGYNEFFSKDAQPFSPMTAEQAEAQIGGGAIGSIHIAKNVIRADQVQVGLKSWSSNVVWSNSTVGKITWGAHTFVLADGTTIAVNAGEYSPPDSTNKYYIYYDNGLADYQVTADYAVVQTDNRILVATVKKDSISGRVLISPLNNDGTLITANSVTTGTLSSNNGLTYFDLNNNKFVMNDGTNDRVYIGFYP